MNLLLNDLVAACCLAKLHPNDYQSLSQLTIDYSKQKSLLSQSNYEADRDFFDSYQAREDVNGIVEKFASDLKAYKTNQLIFSYFGQAGANADNSGLLESNPQKIFDSISLKYLPDRSRLECLLREKKSILNIPPDQKLLKNLYQFLKYDQHNQNADSDYVKNTIQSQYEIRFFFVFHQIEYFSGFPLDPHFFISLSIKAIKELQHDEIEWGPFFDNCLPLIKRDFTHYLTAANELITSDSAEKAAMLITEIVNHIELVATEPTSTLIRNSLLDLLKSPNRCNLLQAKINQALQNRKAVTYRRPPSIGDLVIDTYLLLFASNQEDAIEFLEEIVLQTSSIDIRDFKIILDRLIYNQAYIKSKKPDFFTHLNARIEAT